MDAKIRARALDSMDAEGGVVVMRGVMEQGYGSTSNLVMRDRRISATAKAIYAYLCSFTGGGRNVAFPSRDTILADLGISTKTYYKHLNMLLDGGYVTVMQGRRVGSAYTHNTYVIEQLVPGLPIEPKDFVENPTDAGLINKPQVVRGGKKSHTDAETPEEFGDGKISHPQNPVKPQVVRGGNFEHAQISHTNRVSKEERERRGSDDSDDGQLDEHVRELMRASIGYPDDFASVKRAYAEAIANGCSHDQIMGAYAAYAQDYRNGHDSPKYVMHLDTFLRSGMGLRFYALKPEKTVDCAFRPPTADEVAAFVRDKGWDDVDAQQFVDYYRRRDWKCGDGTVMRSWEDAAAAFHRNAGASARKAKGPRRASTGGLSADDFKEFNDGFEYVTYHHG